MPFYFDESASNLAKLNIHKQTKTCAGHDFRSAELSELWKELISSLEDLKPVSWKIMREQLLEVPSITQGNFIIEAFKPLASREKPRHKMVWKNFGILYNSEVGEQHLLVGQIYRGLDEDCLDNWAKGVYGYEFNACTETCLAIALDIDGHQPPFCRFLRRAELWQTEKDLENYISSINQG